MARLMSVQLGTDWGLGLQGLGLWVEVSRALELCLGVEVVVGRLREKVLLLEVLELSMVLL